MAAAQYRLGCVVSEENDILNAKQWFEAAALQGDIVCRSGISLYAAIVFRTMPESNFWFNIVSKPDMMPDKPEKGNVWKISVANCVS